MRSSLTQLNCQYLLLLNGVVVVVVAGLPVSCSFNTVGRFECQRAEREEPDCRELGILDIWKARSEENTTANCYIVGLHWQCSPIPRRRRLHCVPKRDTLYMYRRYMRVNHRSSNHGIELFVSRKPRVPKGEELLVCWFSAELSGIYVYIHAAEDVHHRHANCFYIQEDHFRWKKREREGKKKEETSG